MIPERTEQSKQGLIEFVEWINNNIGKTKSMTIIEIGSWTGCSMEIFAQHFKRVICVDPWRPTVEISTEYDMTEVEKLFDNRMKKYNNVFKLKKTSAMYYYDIENMGADVVYIDGAHDYENVKSDIAMWNDMARKAIAGHDYWAGRFDGVIKAVNEMLGKPEKIFSDTSWIVKK